MSSEEKINIIMEKTGLSKKEIEEKIKKEINKMQGLINEDTAIYIIMKQYGLEEEEHKKKASTEKDIPINHLNIDQKNVCVVGRVVEITEPYEFVRSSDKTKGVVSRFLLRDNTGDIWVVLWDDKAKYVKREGFDINTLVRILNGYVRKNKNGEIEIHIGKKGDLEIKPSDVNENDYPLIASESRITKISDISSKMKNVNIKAQLIMKEEPRIIEKTDKTLTIQRVYVQDDTANIPIAFWNEDVAKINNFNEGDIVEIRGLYAKPQYNDPSKTELTFGRNSTIKLLNKIDEKTSKIIKEKFKKEQYKEESKAISIPKELDYIKDINSERKYLIKGFIAKEINRIVIYESCENCKRKVENCKCEGGPQTTVLRAIVNVIIDDGTGTIRATFFGEKAEKLLGYSAIDMKVELNGESSDKLYQQINQQIIGKELILVGKAKFSEYSNQYELNVFDFEYVKAEDEVEKLIQQLLEKEI
ncbi:MAG: OB-fold nucleic acid binding domain-containing protein [Promethearchaeota archaeon]